MEVIEKTSSSGQKIYELLGNIDESVNFDQLIETKELTSFGVDLYAIKRINSIGIKKWIQFFEKLKKNQVQFSYHRVSPAIVEQLITISNFRCGGEVISVVLPYRCSACSTPNSFIKTKGELQGINLEAVEWPCQHCNKTNLEFDDIADEYLRFWGM